MMVETILESSQDFGMSNGSLPQWKRELLQRRAARSRTTAPPVAPPPPPPPPPPLPDDVNDVDDEELRYGPGIVKRLKSRYLSLALRDAPRRRPSVLRRAASLEHLLDDRVPTSPVPRPAPALRRPPRPASVAAAPIASAPRVPTARRDSVKRARSVDALSRLERDDPPPPSPSPPPPPPVQPRPTLARAARPPRRPTPLLRETERPPVDLVRSALRKFEATPARRPQPAARVSAVLRELEPPPRTSTPERTRDQSPARSLTPPAIDPVLSEDSVTHPSTQPCGARLVSRAALEEIARAGSTTRYAFDAPRVGSHLPPLAATNPVLVGRARRIGVIRPMPAPPLRSDSESPTPCPTLSDAPSKIDDAMNRVSSPPAMETEVAANRIERREAPPSAAIEPMPRAVVAGNCALSPVVNGRASPDRKPVSGLRKIGAAGIERAWSGSPNAGEQVTPDTSPWGAQRKSRAPPPAATIMVFNFSDRKEVPDYIENDGIVLRASRKNTFKPGEAGVVVLRPEALLRDPDSEDEADCGPPSPCGVRFLNDNVLINGRSSMTTNSNKDRIAKLKLQFDDSLTRTFEYPSENSLCEDSPGEERAPAAPTAPTALTAPTGQLTANTHIASAALSRYTPSKTTSAPFQLGVTRPDSPDPPGPTDSPDCDRDATTHASCDNGDGGEDVRPCGEEAAPAWSAARTHATDLLF